MEHQQKLFCPMPQMSLSLFKRPGRRSRLRVYVHFAHLFCGTVCFCHKLITIQVEWQNVFLVYFSYNIFINTEAAQNVCPGNETL